MQEHALGTVTHARRRLIELPAGLLKMVWQNRSHFFDLLPQGLLGRPTQALTIDQEPFLLNDSPSAIFLERLMRVL